MGRNTDFFFSDSDGESVDEALAQDLILPEPEPVQIRIRTLQRVYAAGQIQLNPYYQRDIVWPAKRQSGLINSIFNNYYIPPVIFQCQRPANYRETESGGPKTPWFRTAIDGKQRLSSIFNFRAGQIPYRDFKNVTWWYPCVEAKGKRGRILTQEMKDKFDNWSLLCIEYSGLTPTQEEELFSRVQQGMSLSNAERQMAGHSPWISMIKDLTQTYADVVHLCDDLKRGKDFGYTANICVMIFYRHTLPPGGTLTLRTTNAVTDRVIKMQEYGPPDAKLQRRIRKTFAVWSDLLKRSSETFTNKFDAPTLRKFSPIEYIATGILIEWYMDERDDATLIDDIANMRKYVRSGNRVIDLRTNTQTWAHFHDYMRSLGNQAGKEPSRRASSSPSTVSQRLSASIIPKEQLILSNGHIDARGPEAHSFQISGKDQAASPVPKEPQFSGVKARKSAANPIAQKSASSATTRDTARISMTGDPERAVRKHPEPQDSPAVIQSGSSENTVIVNEESDASDDEIFTRPVPRSGEMTNDPSDQQEQPSRASVAVQGQSSHQQSAWPQLSQQFAPLSTPTPTPSGPLQYQQPVQHGWPATFTDPSSPWQGRMQMMPGTMMHPNHYPAQHQMQQHEYEFQQAFHYPPTFTMNGSPQYPVHQAQQAQMPYTNGNASVLSNVQTPTDIPKSAPRKRRRIKLGFDDDDDDAD